MFHCSEKTKSLTTVVPRILLCWQHCTFKQFLIIYLCRRSQSTVLFVKNYLLFAAICNFVNIYQAASSNIYYAESSFMNWQPCFPFLANIRLLFNQCLRLAVVELITERLLNASIDRIIDVVRGIITINKPSETVNYHSWHFGKMQKIPLT